MSNAYEKRIFNIVDIRYFLSKRSKVENKLVKCNYLVEFTLISFHQHMTTKVRKLRIWTQLFSCLSFIVTLCVPYLQLSVIKRTLISMKAYLISALFPKYQADLISLPKTTYQNKKLVSIYRITESSTFLRPKEASHKLNGSRYKIAE